MEVSVEWEALIQKQHKISETEIDDMFDPVSDESKILNLLKKQISSFYKVPAMKPDGTDNIVIKEWHVTNPPKKEEEEPPKIDLSQKEIEKVFGEKETFEVDEFTKLLYHKLDIVPQLDIWVKQIDENIQQLQKIVEKYQIIKSKILNLKEEV